MYVKRKMSPNPITISPKQTILEASTVMNNNGLKRLPVLENGKLVGIITAKDIQALSPSKATSLSVYEINYLLTKYGGRALQLSVVPIVSAMEIISFSISSGSSFARLILLWQLKPQ